MARRKPPNNREALIMSLVINGDRYGREIRDEYQKRSKTPMPLGSLYATLERMVDKGFLKAEVGESTHERGGNRRKYYRLAAPGHRALSDYEAWIASIAGGLERG